MLQMGASRPWPDALQALTGKREIDATALIDYFQPLMVWLERQNRGAPIGWMTGRRRHDSLYLDARTTLFRK